MNRVQSSVVVASAQKFTLSVFIVLGVLGIFSHAHAGIFSFLFEDTHAGKQVQAPANSQNMSLLHAALHPDPNPAKGGGSIAMVGGTALLPEAGPSGTLADIEEGNGNNNGQISLYVVREGDSLSQVADMFGVTTNTIIWANDISRASAIQPGQTLTILPISGVRHTVEDGDTLKSIAKDYDGNLEEILEYNGLSENAMLSVGEEIVIPDGEISAPTQTSNATHIAHNTGGPSYEGYYMRPINGGVRTQGLHGYNAVDLASPAGTPIVAAASGQVIISKNYGWNGGYGNYVVIKHGNGTQTLYSHNARNSVKVGQRVVQGQVVGYVGSTGKSTGNHVHFEVRGASNPF